MENQAVGEVDGKSERRGPGQTMRKKIAVGVGLVVVVLAVTVVVCDRLTPTEPQLRVGMTKQEVVKLLGHESLGQGEGEFTQDWFLIHADWRGNQQVVIVSYDRQALVTNWTINPRPRTAPPWLDRAAKVVGW